MNIFNKDEPVESLYQEFKGEVNQLVKENLTKIKENNKRKSIRILIKAKKLIKKEIKAEGKNLSRDKKYMMIARMKNIEGAIKEESQKQYQQKIEKVVDRLRGRNGVNIPNMWEIMKKVEKKEVEPPTAIRSKDGELIEDPEKIKERYLEHFVEILKNVPAETEDEKEQENFIENAFERIMLLADNKETRYTSNEEMQAAVS